MPNAEIIANTIIALAKFSLMAYGIFHGSKVIVHFVDNHRGPNAIFPPKRTPEQIELDNQRLEGTIPYVERT